VLRCGDCSALKIAVKWPVVAGQIEKTFCHDAAIIHALIGFTTGVEFMNKLIEIRRQEFLCRERASLDSERRIFWLAEAEAWEQRALDEIAYYFRECNLESTRTYAAVA
jgi:hypothetical protein